MKSFDVLTYLEYLFVGIPTVAPFATSDYDFDAALDGLPAGSYGFKVAGLYVLKDGDTEVMSVTDGDWHYFYVGVEYSRDEIAELFSELPHLLKSFDDSGAEALVRLACNGAWIEPSAEDSTIISPETLLRISDADLESLTDVSTSPDQTEPEP